MNKSITTPSLEQLPSLDEEYPLTQEQIADFKRDGHLQLNDVVTSEEIEAYRSVLINTANGNAQHQRLMVEGIIKDFDFGKQHEGIEIFNNFWHLNPMVSRFVLARRFGKIAADLMGVDTVRLFLDQAFVKKPGGNNTAWHQDAHFTPLDMETTKIITIWIPLSDVSVEMAPMTFATGSHKLGYIRGSNSTGNEDMEEFQCSLVEKGYKLTNYGAIKAGDVTVHDGFTLHCARKNVSQNTRHVIAIVYYADGAKISIPELPADASKPEYFVQEIRKKHLSNCFPGLKQQDLAKTEKNPIIYQR